MVNLQGKEQGKEVYMITEHKRKEKKGKVRFNMIVNKIVISAVVMATLTGSVSTAYAQENMQLRNLNNNAVQGYYKSLESIIYEVNTTIKDLRVSKNANITAKLLMQLKELELSYNKDSEEEKEEVLEVINSVIENVELTKEQLVEIESIKNRIKGTQTIYITNAKASLQLSDIAGHWAKENIQTLIEKGAIGGYPDSTFKPNNTITRAEFLAIALKSVTTVEESTSNLWYMGVYNTGLKHQIISIEEYPVEDMNKAITRGEMAKIIIKITENLLGEQRVEASKARELIKDYNSIEQDKKQYVEQTYKKGVIGGYPDGTFKAGNKATRAEAATMLIKLIDSSKRGVMAEEVVVTEGTKRAEQLFKESTVYTTDMGKGLSFAGVGYTVEDVEIFAKSFLAIFLNYDGTDKKGMDKWEQELLSYMTTEGKESVAKEKQSLIASKDKCKADVYIDASRIEIKEGRFYVHAVGYDNITRKTFTAYLRVEGHNLKNTEIAITHYKITEIK